MYIYIYNCIHMDISVRLTVFTHIYIYTYIYTYTHTAPHIKVYIYIHSVDAVLRHELDDQGKHKDASRLRSAGYEVGQSVLRKTDGSTGKIHGMTASEVTLDVDGHHVTVPAESFFKGEWRQNFLCTCSPPGCSRTHQKFAAPQDLSVNFSGPSVQERWEGS